MGQIYSFWTRLSPEVLTEQLPKQVRFYNEDMMEDLLFRETDGGFMLGLERSGYSAGFWYRAAVTAEQGGSRISGVIILEPQTKQAEKMTWRAWLQIALYLLLGWPLMLLVLGYWLVNAVRRLIKGLPLFVKKEDKLMDFMINHMGFVFVPQEDEPSQ